MTTWSCNTGFWRRMSEDNWEFLTHAWARKMVTLISVRFLLKFVTFQNFIVFFTQIKLFRCESAFICFLHPEKNSFRFLKLKDIKGSFNPCLNPSLFVQGKETCPIFFTHIFQDNPYKYLSSNETKETFKTD